jgi:hypothetical protein
VREAEQERGIVREQAARHATEEVRARSTVRKRGLVSTGV